MKSLIKAEYLARILSLSDGMNPSCSVVSTWMEFTPTIMQACGISDRPIIEVYMRRVTFHSIPKDCNV